MAVSHTANSIKEINEKNAKIVELETRVVEQEGMNDLLKGCIMEICDVVFAEVAP